MRHAHGKKRERKKGKKLCVVVKIIVIYKQKISKNITVLATFIAAGANFFATKTCYVFAMKTTYVDFIAKEFAPTRKT